MSLAQICAVPSDAPGGLDAAPSAHFGHCAAYTLARVENGQISEVHVLANQGHEHGSCIEPVHELAKVGVKALLAGGMGRRPLEAMHAAGIKVYHATGFASVGEALKAFAAGSLKTFGEEELCKGCGGQHHKGLN